MMFNIQHALKAEFTNFKNTLRRSMNAAKRLYYMRTFALYKNKTKKRNTNLIWY